MLDPVKLIGQGSKPFLKGQCLIEVIVLDHKNYDTLEVILYEAAVGKEAPRIYLNYSVMVSKLSYVDIENRIRVVKDALLRKHTIPDYVFMRELAVNEAILDFIAQHLTLDEYSVDEKLLSLSIQLQVHDLADELQGGYDIHELTCEKPDGLIEYPYDSAQKSEVVVIPLQRNDSMAVSPILENITPKAALSIDIDTSIGRLTSPQAEHQHNKCELPKPLLHQPLTRQKSVRKSSFSIGMSALKSSLQRSLAYVGANFALDTGHKHYKIPEDSELAKMNAAVEPGGTATTELSLIGKHEYSSTDERKLERDRELTPRTHAYDRAIAHHSHSHNTTPIVSPRQPLSRTPSGHILPRHAVTNHRAQVPGLHQFPSSRLLAANRVECSSAAGSEEYAVDAVSYGGETLDDSKKCAVEEEEVTQTENKLCANIVKQASNVADATVVVGSRTPSYSASRPGSSRKESQDITPPSAATVKLRCEGKTGDIRAGAGKPPLNTHHLVDSVDHPTVSSRKAPSSGVENLADPHKSHVKSHVELKPKTGLPVNACSDMSGATAVGANVSTKPKVNTPVAFGTSSNTKMVRIFFDMVSLSGRNAVVVPFK